MDSRFPGSCLTKLRVTTVILLPLFVVVGRQGQFRAMPVLSQRPPAVIKHSGLNTPSFPTSPRHRDSPHPLVLFIAAFWSSSIFSQDNLSAGEGREAINFPIRAGSRSALGFLHAFAAFRFIFTP